ncbi:MAG: hypothetical protein LKK13_05820 [Bacilli bacterium]|jgi:hypothetical protein|nr:hypothetical protein [Bacilli bacterium]
MNYSNRVLTQDELSLCDQQASLFKMAALDKEIQPAYFVRSFMNGEYARFMDDYRFIHSHLSIDDVFFDIKGKLKKTDDNKGFYSAGLMNWIGYMYRYWAITRETSSKEIYSRMKMKSLAALYPLYHTQDPEKAMQMIMESIPAKPALSFREYFLEHKK